MSEAEYRVNFRQRYSTLFKMLYVSGVYPESGKIFALQSYLPYTVLVATLFILHLVNRFRYLFSSLDDMLEFLATIGVLLTECMAAVKAIIFIYKRDTFTSLMDGTEKEVFQPRNKRQMDIVNNASASWETIIKIYVYTIPLAAFVMVLIPPFFKADRYEENMPLTILAFYDYKRPIWYEITLIQQYLALSFVVVATAAVDGVILSIFLFLAAQCELLSENLTHLCEEAKHEVKRQREFLTVDDEERVLQEIMCQVFRKRIQQHYKILT